MSKKVIFNKPRREDAEAWIKERVIEPVTEKAEEKKTAEAPLSSKDIEEPKTKVVDNTETRRITLDIPKHWHTRIKVVCAEKGVKMTEAILPLLKEHFSIQD